MASTTQPKRRDRVKTRARILEAAQDAFAETGYSQAGIRAIADRADVSFPMLLHYFGSKIGLFEAALTAAAESGDMFDVPREEFGAALMAAISNPQFDIKFPAMIALATGDAEARAVAANVMEDKGVTQLAEWLGPPDARFRAAQIAMLAIAFVLFTRQLPLFGPAEQPDMIDWMAEVIQKIVDRR